MSVAARRMLGILVGVAIVLTGGALAERSALLEDLRAAESTGAALEDHLADASAATSAWHDLRAERAEQSARFAGLVDARSVFVTALGGASAAFGAAAGKVDTSAQRATIQQLQDTVHAERSDRTVVVEAASAVDGTAASVRAAVAAYDAEQQRLAEARAAAAARSSGGSRAAVGPRLASSGSAYDRVRAALNRVGGSGVTLEQYEGACGTVSAAACARPSGVIQFTAALATWSDSRLHWAMAHEYAHIRQFAVWGTLMKSAGYASLFGGNIELLANCMAHQRGYPSGNVSCSGAQLDWAASIWNGHVPD